jgi:hypothetical protein
MQLLSRVVLGASVACAVAQGQRVASAQPDPDQSGNQSGKPLTPDNPPDQPPGADGTSVPETSPPPMSDQETPPVADPSAPPMADPAMPADASYEPGSGRFSYAWYEPRLRSGIGISTTLGGGVVGFTDKTMRDTTSSLGGLWDLRVTLGSHIPVALDISYLGSATDIGGLPAGQSATLIGTTVEGALRFNVLPHHEWNPYIFAGAGWQRYDVTQASAGTTSMLMNDKDDLIEFPMGAGVAYRFGGFVADLRGTFRATTEENLVPETPSPMASDFAPMHTWQASAALGYEF